MKWKLLPRYCFGEWYDNEGCVGCVWKKKCKAEYKVRYGDDNGYHRPASVVSGQGVLDVWA